MTCYKSLALQITGLKSWSLLVCFLMLKWYLSLLCVMFLKSSEENIFATVYASQSRKSKTSFKVAIVQEVSGMFGIACSTLAFCH